MAGILKKSGLDKGFDFCQNPNLVLCMAFLIEKVMENEYLPGPCQNGELLAAAQRALLLESHTHSYAIRVDYAGSAVRLTGLVPSFYVKQVAQEVVIHLLWRINSNQVVENAIEVQ